MNTIIKGSALVLTHNIDTDQIYPGRFLELVDPKEIGSHCLSGVDEKIAPGFVQGDIVVAGRNFGCGSSREHAPIALLNMGASVVLAESFARIFFRNAINLGLPLIICPNINEVVKNGDTLEINVVEGIINNISTGQTFVGEKISEHAMSILNAGGIKPLFREKLSKRA